MFQRSYPDQDHSPVGRRRLDAALAALPSASPGFAFFRPRRNLTRAERASRCRGWRSSFPVFLRSPCSPSARCFAFAQERWRNLLSRIALNNMTQGLCMFDGVGPARAVQRALHRNVSFAARAIARRHADARDARSPLPSGHVLRRSRSLRRRTVSGRSPKAAPKQRTIKFERRAHHRVGQPAAARAAAGWRRIPT